MSVVFGALWYLVGADTHRPALNLGLTMLGITWVGGMAGFAALLVRADQIEVLLAAVIITVASDTGAYAGGKALGSRPFHPASPNKTWEGTIVGFIAAVVAGVIIWLLEISVFADTLPQAVLLGAVVGVIGPIGDLTESMVKRDLNTKDMGHLIPGHGGVLDRLDALLFAIPAAYYLGRVLDLF
jgi:phosphatidate cytidylyltransferase